MKNLGILILVLASTSAAQAQKCDRVFADYIIEQGMGESAANDCQGDGIDLQNYREAFKHFSSYIKLAESQCDGKFSYKDKTYMREQAMMIAQDCVNPTEPTPGASYTCSDGTMTVRAYDDGYGFETFDTIDFSQLFNNNHAIEIDYKGRTFRYDTMVSVSTDGAGQDIFQSFYQDGLSGFGENANFYFEHEGGYLAGSVKVPRVYGPNIPAYEHEYEETYEFNNYSMSCEEL